ncbi:MAG: cation-translocating P-type ATPase [bacterium]|nr:cation-translocating P-type ATPase [bacterium]
MPLYADIFFIAVILLLLLLRFVISVKHPYLDTAMITVSILATIPVGVSAFKALRNKKIGVDLLASLALIFSFAAQEWNSAAFVTLMLAFARMVSRWGGERADRALESLVKLRPTHARIKKDGNIIKVPVDQVALGDHVVIALGESVPVDGVVVEGHGLLDQASLTGESLPVERGVGDTVMSSTILVEGSFVIEAKAVGSETSIEKIIRMVEQSQEEKAPIETMADRFATYYIVGMLFVSMAIYLFTQNTGLVLSVLLVVCADEIAVGIPLTFLMAIGRAAKKGVIIKKTAFLEGLNNVKTLIVDKTGTITKGKLSVAGFTFSKDVSEDNFFSNSFTASEVSNHPASIAIAKFLRGKARNESPESYEEISGKGIIVKGREGTIYLGRKRFFDEKGISYTDLQREIEESERDGYNVTLVGNNNKAYGFFKIADEIKGNIKKSIEKLYELGVKEVVMLTGDNEVIAEKIANEAGITKVRANLLPEGKVAFIKALIEKNKNGVVFVGDGTNDAASLKLTQIGIVMGITGSDVAVEAADVVLMHDDFSKIPEMISLSHRVINIARGNFVIWAMVNVVGLYFVFTGVFTPSSAAAYNFLTDFIPLFNAMRVLRF